MVRQYCADDHHVLEQQPRHAAPGRRRRLRQSRSVVVHARESAQRPIGGTPAALRGAARSTRRASALLRPRGAHPRSQQVQHRQHRRAGFARRRWQRQQSTRAPTRRRVSAPPAPCASDTDALRPRQHIFDQPIGLPSRSPATDRGAADRPSGFRRGPNQSRISVWIRADPT